jgi:hypothetical protein
MDDPPSDQITVQVITVNGSGCPAGTAEVSQSDNTSFKIRYHKYVAEGGAAPTDIRKACQLALRFHIPQGFTFAISTVDYRGYADLRPGATATQQALYYLQGKPNGATISHEVNPDNYGRWHTQDSFAEADLVWAACGEDRNLNLKTSLRVYQPAGTAGRSSVRMTRTEGDVDTEYQYSWKHCD